MLATLPFQDGLPAHGAFVVAGLDPLFNARGVVEMPDVAVETGDEIVFLVRGHADDAFVFGIERPKEVFRKLDLRNGIKDGRRRVDPMLAGSEAPHYDDDDQNEHEEVEDEKEIAHQKEQKHALVVAPIEFIHALFVLGVIVRGFTSPLKKDKVAIDLPTEVADFKNQISE